MQANLLDPELKNWFTPDFSTTTVGDNVVAAVLMMGSLQKYFKYTIDLSCSIPSVTFLGEREDWVKLVRRLDKLAKSGAECAKFGQLLKPVLDHFVATFDDPESEVIVDFWQKITHCEGGSGPSNLSGWITAFCFWGNDSARLYGGHQSATELSALYMPSDTIEGVRRTLFTIIGSKSSLQVDVKGHRGLYR